MPHRLRRALEALLCSDPPPALVVHAPVERLVLCLDCEMAYARVAKPICPACGSRTFHPLAAFLDGRKPDPTLPWKHPTLAKTA